MDAGGHITGSSTITTVTAGTDGAKSGYTELIASTASATNLLRLHVCANATRSQLRVYIATGGSGSEVDCLDILFWSGSSSSEDHQIVIPCDIDAGTRVSCAVAGIATGDACDVGVHLYDNPGIDAVGAIETVGIGSPIQGVTVDPGATANTKGAWTEIVASTGIDYDYLIVTIGNNRNSASANTEWLFDIGTGAASSETVLIPNLYNKSSGSEDNHCWQPYYVTVPSGTRIAARAQCDNTDATDRLADISITGVNLTFAAGGGGSGQGVAQTIQFGNQVP